MKSINIPGNYKLYPYVTKSAQLRWVYSEILPRTISYMFTGSQKIILYHRGIIQDRLTNEINRD